MTVEGCHYATLATCAIAAGDEVLVSYGADYWLARAEYGGDASSATRPVEPEASAAEILARGRAGPTTTRARRRRAESGPAKKAAKMKKAASKKGGGGGFGR